ncbi:hypothetical protein V3C99_017023, partial [Haemonchus contortus]
KWCKDPCYHLNFPTNALIFFRETHFVVPTLLNMAVQLSRKCLKLTLIN